MNVMRILIVDTRHVVHLGFKRLLLEETWAARLDTAREVDEATALARAHQPHVAVIGTLPAHQDVSEVCRKIASGSRATKLLLMAAEPISARRARGMGASGVVPHTWHGSEILGAARTVGIGMTVFVHEPDRTTGLLSEREIEILELIGAGATNREIAANVGLSTNTVKDHTSALYKKIKARNRAEAIARAERMGLLA